MTTTTTPEWTEISVAAEDAPIGIQTWPTVDPIYAPNFTLERVEIIRNHRGRYVRWVFESGKDRLFSIGDMITLRVPASS